MSLSGIAQPKIKRYHRLVFKSLRHQTWCDASESCLQSQWFHDGPQSRICLYISLLRLKKWKWLRSIIWVKFVSLVCTCFDFNGWIMCFMSLWMEIAFKYYQFAIYYLIQLFVFYVCGLIIWNMYFFTNVTRCTLTEILFLSSRSRVEHLQKTTHLQTAWYIHSDQSYYSSDFSFIHILNYF